MDSPRRRKMTYPGTSIDRRADYYARAAAVIAADPLDFYTRAERGRRFMANWGKLPPGRSLQPILTAVLLAANAQRQPLQEVA